MKLLESYGPAAQLVAEAAAAYVVPLVTAFLAALVFYELQQRHKLSPQVSADVAIGVCAFPYYFSRVTAMASKWCANAEYIADSPDCDRFLDGATYRWGYVTVISAIFAGQCALMVGVGHRAALHMHALDMELDGPEECDDLDGYEKL